MDASRALCRRALELAAVIELRARGELCPAALGRAAVEYACSNILTSDESSASQAAASAFLQGLFDDEVLQTLADFGVIRISQSPQHADDVVRLTGTSPSPDSEYAWVADLAGEEGSDRERELRDEWTALHSDAPELAAGRATKPPMNFVRLAQLEQLHKRSGRHSSDHARRMGIASAGEVCDEGDAGTTFRLTGRAREFLDFCDAQPGSVLNGVALPSTKPVLLPVAHQDTVFYFFESYLTRRHKFQPGRRRSGDERGLETEMTTADMLESVRARPETYRYRVDI